MTHKDYEKFAAMFRQHIEFTARFKSAKTINSTLIAVAQDMADIFADDNPRFDRDRFLTACGFQHIDEKE